MKEKSHRLPGLPRHTQMADANLAGVGNVASTRSQGQLQFQAVVWLADRKAYTRATYKTLHAAKRAAREASAETFHVYDLSLRMRVA